MSYYRIIEWEQYQHYRDRDPPWIKLHRDTMTSRTWVSADDRSRLLAIACMLIAAGTANKIPADPGYVRRRAYLDYDPDFAPLVALGFIEFVNETKDLPEKRKRKIAPRKQALASDTECSSEGEREERRDRGETEGEERAFAAFTLAATERNWPQPRDLSDDRRKKLRARLKEHGEDGWTEMLAKARASDFITNEFPLKLDWVLEPKNFRKVIEGNYDNRSTGPPSTQKQGWN